MKLIFLDTESTGIDPAKDRLCQVCYRTDADGTRVEYFKPPVPISIEAMSITHITNKMVSDKPAFMGSGMQNDLSALLAEGVLVAHNAKFDKTMLELEGLKVPRFICTLRLARHLDAEGVIPKYNLQYLRYYLDLDVAGSAHDAEGDVNVLYAVYQRLFAKVRAQEASDEAAIAKMIDISGKPSLFRTFNFGKHMGKRLEDVAKTDRNYLEWLLGQKLASGEDDEDWIYTLKFYLGKA
ncbi:MAG: exonuclease domain-containing protein [Candidatus Paceibacterota bacterium]|jgi:DNA polymerase III epsilon subunit-like protein